MEKSIVKYLEESLKKNWKGNALTDLQGDTLTYEQLTVAIEKLHLSFEACGVQRGDKVAIVGKNSMQWAKAFFATLLHGAVPVPLLHEFKPDAIHHLVNHSESKLLFVEESIWNKLDVEKMPALQAVVRINDMSIVACRNEAMQTAHDNADALFAAKYPNGFGPDDVSYQDVAADDLAVINYTSGSTGNSKGVMIPHRALASNMQFALEHLTFLLPGDGVVCMLPLAHMYGLMIDLIHPIVKGCHVNFLTRSLSPKVILESFAEVKPKLIEDKARNYKGVRRQCGASDNRRCSAQ